MLVAQPLRSCGFPSLLGWFLPKKSFTLVPSSSGRFKQQVCSLLGHYAPCSGNSIKSSLADSRVKMCSFYRRFENWLRRHLLPLKIGTDLVPEKLDNFHTLTLLSAWDEFCRRESFKTYIMVIPYRRFGTTSVPSSRMKKYGPDKLYETSVRNYRYTLRKIPE